MGFWSGLLKVAKVAAPIALAATGVGAPLAMAAKGGLDALDAKVSGAGWKGALGAGALGAATGAIPGVGGAVAKGASGAVKSGVGSAVKSALTNPSTLASLAGGVGGALAKGAEKGRMDENTARSNEALFKQREAEAAEQALQNRAALDLRQKQFGADELRNNYQSALQAAFGKNVQDVSVGRPAGIPTISFGGGARPSALGPEGRAAAALMYDKAFGNMRDGVKFDALPAIERVSAPEFKKAGFFENLMGGVGTAGKAVEGVQAQQNAQESSALLKSILDELRQGGTGTGGTGTPPPANAPTFTPAAPRPAMKPSFTF